MGVTNGQAANAATFNAGFMSRNSDTSTTGVVTLNNVTDVDSGSEILNLQQSLNELFDADGTAGQDDAARKTYSSTSYVSNGSSRKTAIGVLDAAIAALAPRIASAFVTHAITDGQSATNLTDQTVDSAVYTSAVYEYEVIRGTTVMSNGRLAMQCLNGTWRVETGSYEGDAHGITFTVTQSTTVGQLKAALDSGAGDGTIKMSRRLVAI